MNVVALERSVSDLGKKAALSRARLFELIKKNSYRYSPTQEFSLSSGEKSNFYFNMKMTMLVPEGINLIADVLEHRLAAHGTKYVAGLELGAVPLIMAACMRDHSALIVRKAKKEHGTKELVEGPKPPKDTEVILLDDVTTKGGSVLAAVREVRSIGCKVKTVITLVDRQSGAREKLASESVTLEPIFTLADFHNA